MDAPDLSVANDDGTDLIRAMEIAAVGLDYDGNVTVRLAGHDSMVVTLVAHRTHRDEHKPGDLHRQLLRVMAELGDSSAARIVRPVHDESRGWEWVSEPLQRPAKRGISPPCGNQPAAGYIVKQKNGRRNRSQIQAHLPLPEPTSQERTVGEVLALLAGAGARP